MAARWPPPALGIFAHIPGGGDVASGNEPLFAWVRLRIHDLCRELPLEKMYGFNLFLQAPHVTTTMSTRDNIRFAPDQAAYPRRLRPETGKPIPPGLPHPRTRRQGSPGRCPRRRLQQNPLHALRQRAALGPDARPASRPRGAFVDLLVPMLPCPRKIFDAELALSRDAALRRIPPLLEVHHRLPHATSSPPSPTSTKSSATASASATSSPSETPPPAATAKSTAHGPIATSGPPPAPWTSS